MLLLIIVSELEVDHLTRNGEECAVVTRRWPGSRDEDWWRWSPSGLLNGSIICFDLPWSTGVPLDAVMNYFKIKINEWGIFDRWQTQHHDHLCRSPHFSTISSSSPLLRFFLINASNGERAGRGPLANWAQIEPLLQLLGRHYWTVFAAPTAAPSSPYPDL